MTKAHSHIGASSMDRWASCPGSVRLSAGMENRSSEFAAHGTAAHGVAEACLRSGKNAKDFIGETLTADGFTFEVDDEMVEAVQVYLDAVRRAYLAEDANALLHVEVRFDLSQLHDGLFGTSDCCVWQPKHRRLKVYDFKFGAGIPVEVKDNPQLAYYALGAITNLNLPAHTVEMVIVQPRCPHPDGPVRSWSIDVTELMDFRHDLIQYAKATEDPDAPLNPGDHCRWCLAAPVCPALHQKAQEVAANEFRPDLSYDPDKLAETLRWLPVLEGYAKSVREFAYAEAEHGRCPPRWKLVAKRASRKWRDEPTAIRRLVGLGLGEPELYGPPALLSPAKIEKVLGKSKLTAEVLSELTVTESSGHTLAPESDKRPAVKPAAADEFSAV